MRRTFVLVHGAWHGGWCWRRVCDPLEGLGHKVYAPTLAGLADRSHLLSPAIDLAAHASDIANLIKWERLEDVVLVGHSYGGMVVTEVAERVAPAIASIVYLDAFLPEPGQRLLDLASPATRKAIEEAIATGATSLKPIPPAVFGVNEADRAWVEAMCTPQPAGTFTQAVSGTRGRDAIPRRTYIRASAYASPSFDAALTKAKALPGWSTYEVDCGHDVMVDSPQRLVEILIERA